MSVNYKRYEFRVYEHISRLDELLRTGGSFEELKQWQSEVAELRRNFETKHFRVAVVGEFNRGKTTFVNALLGKEILPSDYLPTTAAVSRITYNDEPSAYIVLKNGQKQYVQIAELAEYVTKLSAASIENASQIHEAVVEYPTLFCRNGVDLIDTPGMNDEDAMNQVTISRLEGIDLAIVAVDASMPFSMTECAFTVQLLESPHIYQIIIVVTKIDMIRDRERQKLIDFMIGRIREDIKARLEITYAPDSEMMRKYHDIFDDPYVFAVSGADALDALTCNNMGLFEESGFLHLNNELPKIIMRSQNNSIILNTELELCNFISKYREWICQRQITEQQLNEMKVSFAQICYENASKAFALKDVEVALFLPNMEEELTVIRKRFIQALGDMKMMTYEELRRVFYPVMKNLFQELNKRYHAKENTYLENYQEKLLRPLGRYLLEKVNILFNPLPEMYQSIETELTGLLDYFELKETGGDVWDFYWVRSPIPEEGALGTEWNVMAYVDEVIQADLADYQQQRWLQIVQQFKQAKTLLDDRVQEIVKEVYHKTANYIEQLKKGEEQSMLHMLLQLESDSHELREEFLAEVGQ